MVARPKRFERARARVVLGWVTPGKLGHHSKFAYKLRLLANLKIRPVFHVSWLKQYYEDTEDPNHGVSQRASVIMTTSFDKEAESILDTRLIRRCRVLPSSEYLVK